MRAKHVGRTTIRRSVAAREGYSLALATRYQMLDWPTPTSPGLWPGGQRTGVDDDLDKRERPAGTLTRLVSRPIRALARLFLCAPDSDVINPSELTLVPDPLYEKELDQEVLSCTVLSTPKLEASEESLLGHTMDVPMIYGRSYTMEETYWLMSPPITYSPGPLKFYVPVELFQLVLEGIDSSPKYPGYYVLLRQLRLVSRTWRSETDRFFFRDFSVKDGRFVDFARGIVACPKRGSLIRALRVDWAQQEPAVPDDLDVIRRAFMLMPNLEDLRERYSGCQNHILYADAAQILKGVPFRLRTWDTVFRWCPELEDILLEQTDVRKFICNGDISYGTSPPLERLATSGILPRCDNLHVGPGILPTFQNIGDVPSVRHLNFHIDGLRPDPELMAAPGARFIGTQLTSLVLHRISLPTCEFTPSPDLIREFIGSVPNLLLFGLIDSQILTPHDNAQIRNMICENLPRLRTFVWSQNVQAWAEVEEFDDEDLEGDDVESDDSDVEEETGERLGHHEKFGRYARKFFADHPALEYVTGYFLGQKLGLYEPYTPDQSLYKRIWDDKHPDGYIVIGRDDARTISYNTCDLIDPRAPEDYLLHGYVNPERFNMPNPALPALSMDSDSD